MRTAPSALKADAAQALLDALHELGVHWPGSVGQTRAPDLVLILPDGSQLVVEVKAAAVPTPTQVRTLTHSGSDSGADAHVLVGDELSQAARRTLQDEGWGWLDRRGHLRLRVPDRGVVVDSDVRPANRPGVAGPKTAVRGLGGLAYAMTALMHPDVAPSVRDVARTTHLAPSSVSAGRKALLAASLLRRDGTALIPELFWAVEEVWRPRFVALEKYPHPDIAGNGRLDLALDDPQQPGWALTDTLAAIAWGAPLVAPGSHPPDFYVPSSQSLRRATTILGEAPNFDQRGASVAVAPIGLVTALRYDHGSEWLLTHPVVVALDLARDPSRGREALESWDPERTIDYRRVW